MKGFKRIQTANFNCVFGIEKNIPLLTEFNKIVYPAFKLKEKKSNKANTTRIFFKDIKLYNSDLGYCLYGKIVKDTILTANTQLDQKDNLLKVNKTLASAPYSEFILILKNHKLLFIPSQAGSPTLHVFKNLITHNIKKLIHRNDFREDNLLLKVDLEIYEIPEELKLKHKFEKIEAIDYFKFKVRPQNARLFDGDYFNNLEKERKEIGADTIEQKIVKPSKIEKIKKFILDLSDMAHYSIRMKEKDKDWETIKNSTYKKEIEYVFPEENSDEENIKEAIRLASYDRRISKIDSENDLVYNNSIDEIKNLN